MDLELEYQAAVKHLSRMQKRAPRRYSEAILAVGLVDSEPVVRDVNEYRARFARPRRLVKAVTR